MEQHFEEEELSLKVNLFHDLKKKKPEERILVIGDHRIYAVKPGPKVRAFFKINWKPALSADSHILDITEISSPSPKEFIIKSKSHVFASEDCPEEITNKIIGRLRQLYKDIFINIPETDIPKFNVVPEDRFLTFFNLH